MRDKELKEILSNLLEANQEVLEKLNSFKDFGSKIILIEKELNILKDEVKDYDSMCKKIEVLNNDIIFLKETLNKLIKDLEEYKKQAISALIDINKKISILDSRSGFLGALGGFLSALAVYLLKSKG